MRIKVHSIGTFFPSFFSFFVSLFPLYFLYVYSFPLFPSLEGGGSKISQLCICNFILLICLLLCIFLFFIYSFSHVPVRHVPSHRKRWEYKVTVIHSSFFPSFCLIYLFLYSFILLPILEKCGSKSTQQIIISSFLFSCLFVSLFIHAIVSFFFLFLEDDCRRNSQ